MPIELARDGADARSTIAPSMKLALVFFVFNLLPLAVATETEVLYIGDPFGSSPYFALTHEPGIALTPIPAFVVANSYPKSWGSRLMRNYFPRSYEDLSNFDVLVLSDARMNIFTQENLAWMKNTVLGGGGLAMIGGLDSFSGIGENSWHNSPVGDLLPVSGGRPEWVTAQFSWYDPKDPLMASLPFEQLGRRGTFTGFNLVKGKPGSKVVARLDSQIGTSPLIVYWEFGDGISFSLATEWKGDSFASFCRTLEECHLRGTRWGNEFASWEFSPDFARNVVYLLAGRPLPGDSSLPHVFRSKSNEYDLGISLAIMQIEVLHRLGVPTEKMEDVIDSAQRNYSNAQNLYKSGRIAESIVEIDEALSTLSDVGAISSELEGEHLTWVYMTQLATISSAAILCGLALERARSRYFPKRPLPNREE